MQNLNLRLHHETFGPISDRSARQILKMLSKSLRMAQMTTLENFIYSLELSHSDTRSLIDTLHGHAAEIPAYNVQKLQKGSLELLVISGVGLVMLLAEHGQSRGLPKTFFRKLGKFLKKDYATETADHAITDLRNRGLGNDVVADDVEVVPDGKDIEVRVELKTAAKRTKHKRRTEPTAKSVDAFVKAAAKASPDDDA
ncbi:hypothetical protein [Caulobacter sp. RHG1]|uniref:hypothetical protein n=1 Tax=Caulobacter sp. (strain RHG1) TaxID=2545762 RepID=UPI0015541D21|nr:hypothetical protein [Caulobacter sp. RHG1]NQE64292.1 hypothetical protein [Caulobacter sp. RHG1]